MSLPESLAAAQPSGPRSPLAALAIWFERHAQTFVASLGRLVRQPFASLLTTAVIGLGLALPVCLHLIVVNARTVTAIVCVPALPPMLAPIGISTASATSCSLASRSTSRCWARAAARAC